MMDEQSKKMLDELTVKEIAALTEDDIKVLRARRSYLTPQQQAQFASVLEETETESEEAKPKKGKKTESED